ncbi:MAG: SprT-like domain-containing protein [Acetobacteraceae bacterium]
MSDSNTQTVKPTRETYDPLQLAYDTLNRALFDNSLPNCLITLQRRKRTYGYFCGDRFGRADGTLTDEIALNPSHFRDRPQEEVLATLAHEMVHLWQHHFGKPGRGRYHNIEWAEKMKSIGLQPTSTGKEGGAEIGDVMAHMIVPDGLFDRAVKKMLAKGLVLSWTEQPERTAATGDEMDGDGDAETPTKSGKRVKYVCPHGDMQAWARHDAKLVCGEHMEAMQVEQPVPPGYREITPTSGELADLEEDA